MSVVVLAAATIAALGVAVACGGSSSSSVLAPPPDAGADGVSGEASAAAEPYTLDNVCARIPPIACEIRKPCCTEGPGFDEAGCLAHAKAECEKDVAEVRAGRETFHPERIEGCIPKFRKIFESCDLTFDLLQVAANDLAACQTFEGQVPTGGACERTAQCAPATGGSEVAGCDDDTKKCKTTKVLAEGAECSFADGFPGICGEGLYCDIDFERETSVLTGVCKKKTALGVACDADQKPFNLECGLGNYCEPDAGTCTVGRAGGAACTEGFECNSVVCEKGGGKAGTCKAVTPLAKAADCKGP